MLSRIGAIIGAILLLASFVGVVYAVDTRYATAEEVSMVSERLDAKILNDQIVALEARIWDLVKRWRAIFIEEQGRRPKDRAEVVEYMDDTSREAYRQMMLELEQLEAQRQKEPEK